MQILIGIINGIAENIPTLIQAVMNLIGQLFKGIVEALNGIDTDNLIKAIAGVGLLTGLVVALSLIVPLIPSAMAGVLALGALIAEMSLVLAAVGGLAQIPGLQWLINEGGDLLQSIGNAIGKFVGGIIGGIAEGVTSALPQIGTNLSQFMTNLIPFINGVKMIDQSVIESVKSLASVIMIITGASLLESITSFITGESSISTFASELPRLGVGLKAFSDSVAGINIENIMAASNAGKALAEMCSIIPNSGGMVAWFTGENSISQFGSELPKLGSGLKAFSDSVAGINAESIIAASNAGKAITDLCSEIPNSGGMVAWFTGENSISKFSSELINLGKGLKSFSDATNGLSIDGMILAANAGKALAGMCEEIPNSGGMVAWFTGENSISKFGFELISLGNGLKGFSEAIAGMNVENVMSATYAAKSLAQMTESIPNSGGIVSWFTGENSITAFAGELPKLGKGLKAFSDSLNGLSPANVTAAANAGKSLSEMMKNAPSDPSKIVAFGDKLSAFGDKLKAYFGKVSAITSDSISKSSSAISSISNATKNIDTSKMSQVSSAIDRLVNSLKGASSISVSSATGFTSSLRKIGEAGVNSLLKAFSNAESKVSKAGESMINKVIDGAKSKSDAAKKAFKSVVEDCTKDIKTDGFYNAGEDVVKGFANGISENTWRAEAKAAAMAEAAKKAAKKALREHSPSKEFYKIGDFAGLGFVNALGTYEKKSYKVSTDVANSAKKGLSKSIVNLASLVDTDINSQPTIRPVLDLSAVSDGAGVINSMFDMQPSVGVMSDISSVSSMMNSRQNGNVELLSAVKGLRKDIADSNGGVSVDVHLDYNAGSDANEIANDIATSLRRAIRRGV